MPLVLTSCTTPLVVAFRLFISVLVNMAISNRLSQCTGPLFRVASWARRASSTARFSLGLFLSGGSFTVNVLTDIQIESLAHFERERIV